MLLGIKTFGGNDIGDTPAVPNYMRTAEYNDPDFDGNSHYYGCYPYGSAIGGPGGFVVSFHLEAVRIRFQKLMNALAQALDNSKLEMICMNENSINKPVGAIVNGQGDWIRVYTWFEGMTNVYAYMQSRFLKTNIMQLVNADRKYMSTLVGSNLTGYVPDIVALDVGLGMPDGCLNDDGFQIVGTHPGNIYLLNYAQTQHSPRIVNMSGPAQLGSVANPKQANFPGPGIPRQQAQDWARTTCKANYIWWMHMPGTYNTTFNSQNGVTTAQPASDSISGAYLGKYINKVTDDWINHASSDISVASL